MRMTRRTVLRTGTAAMAAPLFTNRAFAADTDVVVIGAGAAGVSAARELAKRGLTTQIIEADGRIGGRVFTDTNIFNAPYDVGAHWLHNRRANPFVDYGIENGFDLYASPDEAVFYVGDRLATEAEQASLDVAMDKALGKMLKAGARRKDVAAADVVPDAGTWGPTVDFLNGAYEIGKDLDSFSVADWYTAEEGEDWFCREGFGALFAHSARDMNAALNTRANIVRWGGQGVTVETNQGALRAHAVIITVSMGVLGGGDITFDPPLPDKKQEAIAALTMGNYNHVALQMKDNVFGAEADTLFAYKIDEMSGGSPKGFGALIDASGHGVTYCDLGGAFAGELSDAGEDATIDFVMSELKAIFGSAIEASVVKTHTFDWTRNPLTKGAYSAASPGGAWSRAEMRKSEGDRLWFAGEATSKDDWATVAGAHKSGKKTAKRLAKKLKA